MDDLSLTWLEYLAPPLSSLLPPSIFCRYNAACIISRVDGCYALICILYNLVFAVTSSRQPSMLFSTFTATLACSRGEVYMLGQGLLLIADR